MSKGGLFLHPYSVQSYHDSNSRCVRNMPSPRGRHRVSSTVTPVDQGSVYTLYLEQLRIYFRGGRGFLFSQDSRVSPGNYGQIIDIAFQEIMRCNQDLP